MSRSCTELTEHRFVTNLKDIFSVRRIVFSQTLPNFRSLLFIVQVAMILNLADDAQQNHYGPTIVKKFVLMNVSLFEPARPIAALSELHYTKASPGIFEATRSFSLRVISFTASGLWKGCPSSASNTSIAAAHAKLAAAPSA
jgi:hypothetical protein